MSNWLESDKLILRPFKLIEWKNVYKYTSKPEVWKYIGEKPQSEQETRIFIATCVEQQTQRDGFGDHIAIILKPKHELIGHIMLRWLYKPYLIMETSMLIDPQYQGKGYAGEALKNIIKYAFTKTEAHRIVSSCDSRNRPAIKVMEKAGMRREGHFKKAILTENGWQDEYFYAILKGEK